MLRRRRRTREMGAQWLGAAKAGERAKVSADDAYSPTDSKAMPATNARHAFIRAPFWDLSCDLLILDLASLLQKVLLFYRLIGR